MPRGFSSPAKIRYNRRVRKKSGDIMNKADVNMKTNDVIKILNDESA